MAIKKSDGKEAVWIDSVYRSKSLPEEKYPPIEPGDRGIVVPFIDHVRGTKHGFYPRKWGYIYFTPARSDQFEFIED